ncbi:hypothetical protein Ahy_Scaffold5g107735 [Arachis hypogaea]|uniref:Uncharacterized protein n=1 Tax=Arachis hypogaea TaxID=3818 RepID=A0A444WQ19_ARAHY|nr:hypothetical protein Ahy_Scaffold5g107735 [Arachis hypogaea]
MLEDVCEGQDHLTIWLRMKIKKAMLVHWKTDEGFRHQHLTNSANRTSAKSSKYTSGSTTFMKTKAKLRLEAATQKSQQNREDADGSAASVIDSNAVWHETTSAPYKNCVYGLGSFFASSLRTFTLRLSSISATS